MSGIGLRNWRGEIIQPNEDAVNCCLNAATVDSESAITAVDISLIGMEQKDRSALDLKERQSVSVEKKVFRKDEFGRDVEVCVDEKRPHKKLEREEEEDGKKERKHKHKHKKHKRQREKSSGRVRSSSPRGRLVGTPPPPDPFRPQMDDGRGDRPQRCQHDRSRSRCRSYSYREKERRSREEADHRRGRGDSSRYCSRSRGRKQSRSPPPRSHRQRSSASVERKWTHSPFNDRSQSPPREPDPLYRPEPEAWVSRAGGVYLPRK